MKRFLLQFASFILIPVFAAALIACFYVKRDVYADFGQYRNYSWKYSYQSLGDISTKKLLHSSVRYNSFILGSSRVTSLYACYLQKKIPHSLFFHYANWNETIGGMYAKLKLLDSLGYRLDHVVMYLDTDYTFANDGSCNKNDHYLLTGENRVLNYLDHYRTFIPPLLDLNKAKILLGYKAAAVYPDWESDSLTNDSNHSCADTLSRDYKDHVPDIRIVRKVDSLIHCGFLYKRPASQHYAEKQISVQENNTLLKIKQLLAKNCTDYTVLITPLYDQLKFDPADQSILQHVFAGHLYDYSGINDITNNPYNYPDRKHFLPYISKIMADSSILCHRPG